MVEIKYVPTICPYCGTGCGLNFVVKDGKIVEKEKYTTDLNDNMYSGMNTRVTYVDDYYYVIDNTLDVKSFELK